MKSSIKKIRIIPLITVILVIIFIIILVCNGYDQNKFIADLDKFINWKSRNLMIWCICGAVGILHFLFASAKLPATRIYLFQVSNRFLNSMLNALTCAAILNSAFQIAGELISAFLERHALFQNSNTIDYISLILSIILEIGYCGITIWKLLEDIIFLTANTASSVIGIDDSNNY